MPNEEKQKKDPRVIVKNITSDALRSLYMRIFIHHCRGSINTQKNNTQKDEKILTHIGLN